MYLWFPRKWLIKNKMTLEIPTLNWRAVETLFESLHYLGFAARKYVFVVSEKARFQPACSASETS